MKRIVDLAIAVPALIILTPLFIAIALAVRLDSRGPIFYRGERIGMHGRVFQILKFRTMVPDAEGAGTTTGAGDNRVTRLGWTLRRWKLDEIPQLINIMRGDMSLVGPRPEVAEHVAEYTEEEREILSVPPGITDLSSIYFFRLTELLGSKDPHGVFLDRYRSVKNGLRLDYARSHSGWLDFCILVATATAMLSRGQWTLRLSPRIPLIAKA